MQSRPYPKIETLFDRDKETFKVTPGAFRRPEFAIIDPWVITEKIDGTNIRLHFSTYELDRRIFNPPEIGGRTDRALFPPRLKEALEKTVAAIEPNVQAIMQEHWLESLTIYGEGYGAGIQKGGGNYRPDPGFIAFDMLANGKSWLSIDQARHNADQLGLDFVPVLGQWPAATVIRALEGKSFYSALSVGNPAGWFNAEGIVARPAVELKNNRGERVMWKLKVKDF